MSQVDVHDASYYFKCMIGGILACGLTGSSAASKLLETKMQTRTELPNQR